MKERVTYCGHCHTCGAELRQVLDGEEWCPVCKRYRRYRSHGWGRNGEGSGECPPLPLAKRKDKGDG